MSITSSTGVSGTPAESTSALGSTTVKSKNDSDIELLQKICDLHPKITQRSGRTAEMKAEWDGDVVSLEERVTFARQLGNQLLGIFSEIDILLEELGHETKSIEKISSNLRECFSGVSLGIASLNRAQREVEKIIDEYVKHGGKFDTSSEESTSMMKLEKHLKASHELLKEMNNVFFSPDQIKINDLDEEEVT